VSAISVGANAAPRFDAGVRFTPDNDRESRHRQEFMSALPAKADMYNATSDLG
jgi:hypothetical protein